MVSEIEAFPENLASDAIRDQLVDTNVPVIGWGVAIASNENGVVTLACSPMFADSYAFYSGWTEETSTWDGSALVLTASTAFVGGTWTYNG